MSLIGLYPCANISVPTALSITSASFCSVLTATTVTGNFLVLLAVIIDPNRDLRSPFNFFVANLAAADLIVGCLALPMSVDFYVREALSHHPTLLRRDHARRVGSFISTTASLLSLAALTVDRFLAITDPLKYKSRLTIRRAAIASVALLGLLNRICSPLLQGGLFEVPVLLREHSSRSDICSAVPDLC